MRYQMKSQHVVSEIIDGEVILLHLDNGNYFHLVESAADIWQALIAGADFEKIVASALEKFGKESEASMRAFAQELIDEGLAVESEGDGSNEVSWTISTFSPPLLQKYTDMQELLLLDPIHEVAEGGWPHQPVS